MSPEVASHWNDIVQVSAPILGALLSLNVWFLGRLVKKLDRIDSTVTETFPLYGEKFNRLETEVRQMSHDLRDIVSVRERVAILEVKIGRTG
jgi:hypothetical protein